MRTSVATMLAPLAMVMASVACAQNAEPRVGVGILAGDDVGLTDGYTHFDGFVPITSNDGESILFFDGSLLLLNDSGDQLGGNVGLGARVFNDSTNSLLGGYLYYDRRDLGTDEFDQIGVGVESLGELFDARINVNAPLNDRENSSVAFTTVDGECGALLLEDDWSSIRTFLGVYGLFHSDVDSTAGVRGRIEWRLGDRCYLGGYVQHDDLFDTTGGFTFAWQFGGRSSSQGTYDPVRSRLADPIYRRKHIVTGSTTGPDAITTTGTPTPTGTVEETPEEPPIITTGTEEETTGEGTGGRYRPPLRVELDTAIADAG